MQAEFRPRIGGKNGAGVKRRANLRHRVVRSNRFLPGVDGHFRKIATVHRPAESGGQLVPIMPENAGGYFPSRSHFLLENAAIRVFMD